MNESVKAVCVLFVIVAVITASIAWIDDRPNSTTWLFRTVPVVIAIIAIGVMLWMHWRRDLAPDLLAQQVGRYLERNGFCFQFLPTVVDGRCVFLLMFQNRYERSCNARVVLRPVTFRGSHSTLVDITVHCPGVAFGVAKKEVGLPAKLQGRRVSFDVGADVEYPKGKGRMQRFRDAVVLRRDTNFVDAFARTTSLLALLGGHIMFQLPTRIKYKLPNNVATDLPSAVPVSTEILWTPDDPQT